MVSVDFVMWPASLTGVLSELERSMGNLSDNHQRTKWQDRAVCLRSECVIRPMPLLIL